MNKKIMVLILTSSFMVTSLAAKNLPISTEFTDWDKKICLEMKDDLYKGFKKGLEKKLRPLVKQWNKECYKYVKTKVYTKPECIERKNKLYKTDMSKKDIKKWNNDCQIVTGVKIKSVKK